MILRYISFTPRGFSGCDFHSGCSLASGRQRAAGISERLGCPHAISRMRHLPEYRGNRQQSITPGAQTNPRPPACGKALRGGGRLSERMLALRGGV